MTATVEPATVATPTRIPSEVRRARVLGIVYLLLAALVAGVFGAGAEGNAVFRLGDRPGDLDVSVPVAATSFAVAALFAFLGGVQLVRGLGRWTNVVLSASLLLAVLAFLAWAASGQSFSLVGMLSSAVLNGTPIAFGALSGVMCERVAVINIGIEGMLLTGAFVGAVVGSLAGAWWGILAAVASGALLALLLAVLAIRYRVDQIIGGTVINILALGLTSFLSAQYLVRNPSLNTPPILRPWSVPLLGDIPVIGPVLFRQNAFVYALYVLVAVLAYGLFRTRWGLRARAVGEHPKAADTLGIDVYRTRYVNVVLGGMIAGLGGAFFTLGSVGAFNENMTGGRGFIGLAAMIFGRWHPVGALGAALVFGFADAAQVKLAILDTGIPSEFLLMAPYLVTIIVVAGIVGRARGPAADGQPYVKE